MAATLTSRVLGFVRQAVINAIFGASGSADVLNAVFNIPNNLRKLLAEGALSSAFIPVLSQAIADEEQAAAGVPRHVVRNLLTFQYLVLVPLLVLSVVFAGPITRFILDFPEESRQLLAADLFRWFIHYTLLISVSAVMVGSLNSSNHFTVPALTPIVFSVCVITSVLLLHRTLGLHSMTVGILLGGLGQVIFQAPRFVRSGFDFIPSFSFNNPEFRRILRQWLPVVAASSIFVINQQIAILFASGLDDGSSSALVNAVVFWQLPLGVFGVSVTTVLFPRMSREATGDASALRETIAFGVRAIAALLIPSALILGALSYEVVAVAFQRGAFVAANTAMAARVLIAYCTGMVGVGVFNFLQRSFYARGDYRSPALTAVGVLVVDVVLSLWLKETRLRVAGLAVANSVAFTAGAAVLLALSGRALHGARLASITKTVGKSLLAVLPTAGILVAARAVWGTWWEAGSTFANLGRLAATGVVALGLVAVLYYALRLEVVTIVLRRRKS
jgi:putative peptidoglycan lipid II flippase